MKTPMNKADGRPAQPKKGLSRVLRILLAVVAGLILGSNLYRWNASSLAGNALPMPFGTGAAVVLSGSMSPALEVDDLVIVRARSSYEVGDVVVYQSGKDLIVHRIIEINGSEIITKGDANQSADSPISISAIKGEVAVKLSGAGVVVNFLKMPAVGIVLLIGAFVLMEQSFRSEKRSDDEKLDEIKEEIRRLKQELDSGSEDK